MCGAVTKSGGTVAIKLIISYFTFDSEALRKLFQAHVMVGVAIHPRKHSIQQHAKIPILHLCRNSPSNPAQCQRSL